MNLEFVTAEVAATWPEGCWVRCAVVDRDGLTLLALDEPWTPEARDHAAYWECNRFARLPETLPELEGKDVR